MTGLDALAVVLVAVVALSAAAGLVAATADAGVPARLSLPVAAVVALLVGCSLPTGRALPPRSPAGPPPAATAIDHTLPPCVLEDGSGGSTPCRWDAEHRGNGRGTPVVIP